MFLLNEAIALDYYGVVQLSIIDHQNTHIQFVHLIRQDRRRQRSVRLAGLVFLLDQYFS